MRLCMRFCHTDSNRRSLMIHLSFQFVYGIMKQSETVEKLIYGNRRLFPSAVYRKRKAGECFSMLDSEKQKHRDHCKASVASRKRSRSRVLAFRRQHTPKKTIGDFLSVHVPGNHRQIIILCSTYFTEWSVSYETNFFTI